MIVKLQVPIASNVPSEDHLALLYDQERKFELMTPISDEILAQLRGRPKAFFEIDLRDGNPFRFIREVPDQGW